MRLINVTCKTHPIQRSAGGNAIAAAAYRSGEDLYDERSGETKRFSNRGHDVRESVILAPDNAPDWVYERGALWNSVETRERHKAGRPGRDVVIGFAWETSAEQQREMALKFAEQEFVSHGHVCDIAFHKYGSLVRYSDTIRSDSDDTIMSGRDQVLNWQRQNLPFLEAHQVQGVDMPHVKIERLKGGDIRGYKLYQPHAHVLTSPRPLDGDGWSKTRNREFDRKEQALDWRVKWAELQNNHLETWGFETRVSTTKNEGEANLPTRSEDLSAAARHLERKGVETMAGKKAAANKALNEMLGKAADEVSNNDDNSSRNTRVAVWWRNFSNTFHEWKDQFKDKISAFADRLKPDGSQERGHSHE